MNYMEAQGNHYNCVISIKCMLAMNISVPRQKLDLPLDYYSQGVSHHLGKIADSIHEWEGVIAEALGLTQVIVAKIKVKHPNELNLQT